MPDSDTGAKSLCLMVTWVLSPCAQPAAAVTVMSELRATKGLVLVLFVFFPFLLFNAILHSLAVAMREVELG